MSETISIIIYGADDEPQYLVERNGAWQDLGPGPSEKPIDELRLYVANTLDVAMQLVDNRTGPGFYAIEGMCASLYRQLLPVDLRFLLENTFEKAPQDDPPILRLHVAPRFDWIPWEILYGTSYLGLRFQIARLPISRKIPALDEQSERKVRTIHNLLAESVAPLGTPLKAAWDLTFSAPGSTKLVTIPNGGGQWPTRDDVKLAMTQSADLLHLTCHGVYDPSYKAYFWALNPSGPMPYFLGINQDFFAGLNLVDGRPLVFANACAYTGNVGGLLPGFGRELFTQGAQNVVGAFARISKATALQFARRFYEKLLEKPSGPQNKSLPIARALLEVKREFNTKDAKVDPTHLFYCLYGPPGTRFQYAD